MAAEVETMFYTRQTPWHGLGTRVMEAPTSKKALYLAGLDWQVEQEEIYTETFAFTDELLGEGVRYETKRIFSMWDRLRCHIITQRYVPTTWERMLIELVRFRGKLSFDYYKEINRAYRNSIGNMDIAKVEEYANEFKHSDKMMRIIELELWRTSADYA